MDDLNTFDYGFKINLESFSTPEEETDEDFYEDDIYDDLLVVYNAKRHVLESLADDKTDCDLTSDFSEDDILDEDLLKT